MKDSQRQLGLADPLDYDAADHRTHMKTGGLDPVSWTLSPLARGPEQRRFPRVRVTSSFYGYSVDLDLSITVRDVSQGGFSLESPAEFQVGAEHTFLFTSGNGMETRSAASAGTRG